MQEPETKMDDELRPEYDLKSLRVRRVGPERKSFTDNSSDNQTFLLSKTETKKREKPI